MFLEVLYHTSMKYLFYKPIKIKDPGEDVFFWSDTHFNHECKHWALPLWKARGFSSIEEHNECLIERWNSTVSANSTMFHLGDFAFGFNASETFKSVINRVNFSTLYVMPGNHNSGWKQLFELQRNNVWNISSNKRVIFIPNYVESFINNTLVVMSHYPILSFNGQSKGSFCLYGHVHGNLNKTDIGKIYSNAFSLEVCVETQPIPINFNSIQKLFSNREAVVFDSHN